MELTRREFFKLSGAGMGGAVLFGAAGSIGGPAAAAGQWSHPIHKKIKNGQIVSEYATICPFDATGCGFIVGTEGTEQNKVVNIEGDPDHPINRGGACSKGSSLAQHHTVDGKDNERRLTKPLYRAAGSSSWQEKTWDEAISEIAAKIKATRDANFTQTDGGNTVNRTEAIASIGGSALDNEECYLLAKLGRALGLVYIEHHARI